MVHNDVACRRFNLLKVWDRVRQSTDVDVGMGEGPISHSYVRWLSFHVSGRIWGLAGKCCLLSEPMRDPDRAFLGTSMVVWAAPEERTRGSTRVLPHGQTR